MFNDTAKLSLLLLVKHISNLGEVIISSMKFFAPGVHENIPELQEASYAAQHFHPTDPGNIHTGHFSNNALTFGILFAVLPSFLLRGRQQMR